MTIDEIKKHAQEIRRLRAKINDRVTRHGKGVAK